MTESERPDDRAADAAGLDNARREALVKIGKFAAYTAPAMLVTVGTAEASPPAPTSGPRRG